MSFRLRYLTISAVFIVLTAATGHAEANRVTILYDAFTNKPGVATDWGYAALVEYDGKRILFDTGNNAALFEQNVKKLGVDLTHLDFAVISHRHGDHTSGLAYVLKINPRLPIYVPADESFTTVTPAAFMTADADPALPRQLRYFGGDVPGYVAHGTAWGGANLVRVTSPLALSSGIRLITTVSDKPGTKEMPELSLVLDTTSGSVLIVGCSHPGIEKILANATLPVSGSVTVPHIRLIFGGLHELLADQAELEHVSSEILDHYKVESLAIGHCTGERTFAMLQKRLGKQYLYAGAGEIISF